MTRQPLTVREWLEDMRRFASRDADRAAELLNMLDHLESVAESYLAVFDALEAHGHNDADADGFDVVKRVGEIAARDLAIQSLCVEAELIRADGQSHDVAPLLRMFLPV